MSRNGHLICVGGLSGTGKSTLSGALAELLGGDVLWLRSDAVRKELWGVQPLDRLPAEAYHRDFSDKTYAEVNRRAVEGLRAGKTVIMDVVFASEFGRGAARALATENGADFTGLWLQADAATLRERVAARRDDVSDATVEIVEMQMTFNLGAIDWHRIDAGGGRADTLAQALRVLADVRGADVCADPQKSSPVPPVTGPRPDVPKP